MVTGASGLIGSHIIAVLRERGYEPRAFSRTALPEHLGAVEQVRGDVRDGAALRAAMRGCDAVVHTAAVYSYARGEADEMLATNVEGTRIVLDAAASEGVGRVVVTSSAATCGPVPGHVADEADHAPAWELEVPYKRSKFLAERLALERAAAGQDVVVVNPTTTVGRNDRRPTPSGRMVHDVLRRRIRGYIASGGLNVVAAEDVAIGHVLALERGRRGQRYLFGGENLTMAQLFALIARLGGVPAPRFAVPYPLALAVATIGDALARWLGREPSLMVLDEVKLARWPMYFSNAKAKRELGYEPKSAQESLKPAVDWFSHRVPAITPPRSGETRRSPDAAWVGVAARAATGVLSAPATGGPRSGGARRRAS